MGGNRKLYSNINPENIIKQIKIGGYNILTYLVLLNIIKKKLL